MQVEIWEKDLHYRQLKGVVVKVMLDKDIRKEWVVDGEIG
jgi:hypothetical protein